MITICLPVCRRLPPAFSINLVKRRHQAPCTECGSTTWVIGSDWYISTHEEPRGTPKVWPKVCLKCADAWLTRQEDAWPAGDGDQPQRDKDQNRIAETGSRAGDATTPAEAKEAETGGSGREQLPPAEVGVPKTGSRGRDATAPAEAREAGTGTLGREATSSREGVDVLAGPAAGSSLAGFVAQEPSPNLATRNGGPALVKGPEGGGPAWSPVREVGHTRVREEPYTPQVGDQPPAKRPREEEGTSETRPETVPLHRGN
jgi:hypothetical protein